MQCVFTQEVIIAVVSALLGTIVGTLLGWFLGKIKIGKPHLRISDFEEHYIYHNHKNGISGENANGELYAVKCTFNIMIYNSSDAPRALRCLQLKFLDGKKSVVCCDDVMDERTKVSQPYGTTADGLRIINVEGYSSVDINAFVYVSEYKKIHDVKKIFLEYQTDNFKKKKKLVKKTNYTNVQMNRDIKE